MKHLLAAVLAWAGLLTIANPAHAQDASPELRRQAERVVEMLRGELQPTELFAPAFLQEVPAAQVQAVTQQLLAQHGAVRGLARIEAISPTSGNVFVNMERATLRLALAIESQPPHRVIGLNVADVQVRGDTLEAVARDVAALPGETSFAVARLGDGAPVTIAAHLPERPLAIGSTFKLVILAELSRQVRAGQRRWSDVVELNRRSFPSGQLQNWPAGAPVTLHTLASLMISISDNTATDMLLHLVGRENVEAMMGRIGMQAAARNRPFLSTVELFALKAANDADQQAWVAAGEAGRRRLLQSRYSRTNTEGIPLERLNSGPNRIGELEWFASSDDLVRVMDWLRRHGDATAHGIMAISPGVPRTQAQAAGSYVGFKGGSEPGVLNLTWLVRNPAGVWHVVTGSWNNPAAAVDETGFVALMTRALQLVR